MKKIKVIYKITYPNGKIYVGMDLTNSMGYFGSVDSNALMKDLSHLRKDFSARKEILWESETATDAEVRKKEVEFIRTLKSNDSKIGYNQWPKLLK